MKAHILSCLVIGFAVCNVTHAAKLIPSELDPSLASARDKAFTPWSDPEKSSETWKQLSPKNVPIYYERKGRDLSRDIYIPNPGIGYWVLAGLTEEAFFRTHREKLKIHDTLISASGFRDENGNNVYWALWAPKDRANLLTDKMKTLGISQARIEYSIIERLRAFAESLKPLSGAITWTSLALNVLLLLTIILLIVKLRRGRIDMWL
jgi:hypothetical protein